MLEPQGDQGAPDTHLIYVGIRTKSNLVLWQKRHYYIYFYDQRREG